MFSLGSLVALFERAVTFYAELINVNAYDQPGVEAGKKAASEVIEAQLIIQEILQSQDKISFSEIDRRLNKVNSETIFFILRQMCYSNSNYVIQGVWSNPESLIIQRVK